MSRHLILTAVLAAILAVLASGCAGDGKLSAADAEDVVRGSVLRVEDLPAGFIEAVAEVHTNEAIAAARPDTEQALTQYDEWGQLLQYNVQFGPDPPDDIDFSGDAARILNTATAFETDTGAKAALDAIRGLSSPIVEDFLVNEGSGTQITDLQVIELDLPPRGDDSFAWRIVGDARFENGFEITFVADSVYVRYKNVVGNVTTIAYASAPRAGVVEQLTDSFLARIRDSV